MNKYIDAEKLKSIIKVQIKERKEWMKDPDKSDRQDQLWSDLNGEDMSILQIITSLQQEPVEWSEEDSLHLTNAILCAESEWGVESHTAKWLKSFRLQPILKPSKEQMEALMYATGEGGTYNKEALKSLLDDLKKRM